MSMETIAYNIKFFRDQHGWTQHELSEKLMTSRSVIAKWENNVAVPDVASLIKLSSVFDVSLDHIVGNLSFRDDLLKDFKRIYSSKSTSFDEEVVELVEYLMIHSSLKDQLFRLKSIPIKKQESLIHMFKNLIDQVEKL
ncbi:helix-turn-helix domain-containing protein [Virgibacillus byunsanensis]|uniref:Helix-turn-helix domain-containing protein n=1 Tax=Virgibacillus byunsanensis TaxID=570945 RepID=A0ABW3LPX0_9BACI